MKKIIATLTVLAIVACLAFATTGDYLNINAKVVKVVPAFTIKGSLDDTYSVGTTDTIDTNKDISKEPITVKFKIVQSGYSYYKNNAGIQLTVTASALVNGDYSTAVPTGKIGNLTDNTKLKVTAAIPGAENIIKYTVKYLTGSKVIDGTDIGYGTYTWACDDNLAVAEGEESTPYTATITLTYETIS